MANPPANRARRAGQAPQAPVEQPAEPPTAGRRIVDPNKVLAKATARFAGTVADLTHELAMAYTALDDAEEENAALRAELVAATTGAAA